VATNDPWLATGHYPDITLVMPIFHRDRLVAPPAVRLVRSYVSPLDTLDWGHLRSLVDRMRVEAEAIMAQARVPPSFGPELRAASRHAISPAPTLGRWVRTARVSRRPPR